MFLRSFAIQGAWNYRTLIGAGFAFALLPALRVIHGNDRARLDEAVARHAQLFNSHPYLAPVALGAVAVLEATGEDARLIERFKAALRGSLGTLGDQVVWAGWRPVCLLFALALLLAGAPWWAGVVAFLVVYNAGHLGLRGWAYRLGLAEATRVGERLRASPVGRLGRVFNMTGAFLIGLLLPLIIAGAPLWAGGLGASVPVSWGWIVAAVVAAAAGIRVGGRVRTPAVVALLGFAAMGLLFNAFS